MFCRRKTVVTGCLSSSFESGSLRSEQAGIKSRNLPANEHHIQAGPAFDLVRFFAMKMG